MGRSEQGLDAGKAKSENKLDDISKSTRDLMNRFDLADGESIHEISESQEAVVDILSDIGLAERNENGVSLSCLLGSCDLDVEVTMVIRNINRVGSGVSKKEGKANLTKGNAGQFFNRIMLPALNVSSLIEGYQLVGEHFSETGKRTFSGLLSIRRKIGANQQLSRPCHLGKLKEMVEAELLGRSEANDFVFTDVVDHSSLFIRWKDVQQQRSSEGSTCRLDVEIAIAPRYSEVAAMQTGLDVMLELERQVDSMIGNAETELRKVRDECLSEAVYSGPGEPEYGSLYFTASDLEASNLFSDLSREGQTLIIHGPPETELCIPDPIDGISPGEENQSEGTPFFRYQIYLHCSDQGRVVPFLVGNRESSGCKERKTRSDHSIGIVTKSMKRKQRRLVRKMKWEEIVAAARRGEFGPKQDTVGQLGGLLGQKAVQFVVKNSLTEQRKRERSAVEEIGINFSKPVPTTKDSELGYAPKDGEVLPLAQRHVPARYVKPWRPERWILNKLPHLQKPSPSECFSLSDRLAVDSADQTVSKPPSRGDLDSRFIRYFSSKVGRPYFLDRLSGKVLWSIPSGQAVADSEQYKSISISRSVQPCYSALEKLASASLANLDPLKRESSSALKDGSSRLNSEESEKALDEDQNQSSVVNPAVVALNRTASSVDRNKTGAASVDRKISPGVAALERMERKAAVAAAAVAVAVAATGTASNSTSETVKQYEELGEVPDLVQILRQSKRQKLDKGNARLAGVVSQGTASKTEASQLLGKPSHISTSKMMLGTASSPILIGGSGKTASSSSSASKTLEDVLDEQAFKAFCRLNEAKVARSTPGCTGRRLTQKMQEHWARLSPEDKLAFRNEEENNLHNQQLLLQGLQPQRSLLRTTSTKKPEPKRASQSSELSRPTAELEKMAKGRISSSSSAFPRTATAGNSSSDLNPIHSTASILAAQNSLKRDGSDLAGQDLSRLNPLHGLYGLPENDGTLNQVLLQQMMIENAKYLGMQSQQHLLRPHYPADFGGALHPFQQDYSPWLSPYFDPLGADLMGLFSRQMYNPAQGMVPPGNPFGGMMGPGAAMPESLSFAEQANVYRFLDIVKSVYEATPDIYEKVIVAISEYQQQSITKPELARKVKDAVGDGRVFELFQNLALPML